MTAGNKFDKIKAGFDAAKDAAGNVAGNAADAATRAAKTVADSASRAAATSAGVARDAGAVAANTAKGAYAALGGEVELAVEGNLKNADGSYLLPDPVVSDSEGAEIDQLTKQWSKATKPGPLAKAGKKVGEVLPAQLKQAASELGQSINGLEFYKQALAIVGKGFGAIESQAAQMSVSPTYVINRINQGQQSQKVSEIPEICLLRSYDVARIVGQERTQHLMLALTEGAATGAPGFPGIPFNIVLSMFLFFRAVQSIAMFYGYDVKSDPAEMIIAGDVLMSAFGAGEEGPNGNVAAGAIGKVMAISEAQVVRQTVSKGWGAAASHGGIPLIIAQMRALAHNAAKKAVLNAGQKTLEESVFAGVLRQMGQKLSQKAVNNAIPFVGGAIGALFDTGLMDRVLTVADLFYHKRFILEKPARVQMLIEGFSFDELVQKTNPEVELIIEEEPDMGTEATTE